MCFRKARSVLAFSTVCCTVPMFFRDFSRELVTVDMMRLISCRRANSDCNRASREESKSLLLWPCFCAEGLFEDGVCFCVVAPLSGLVKTSSSTWSSKDNCPRSGVSVGFDRDIVVALAAQDQFCSVRDVSIAVFYCRSQIRGRLCLLVYISETCLTARVETPCLSPDSGRRSRLLHICDPATPYSSAFAVDPLFDLINHCYDLDLVLRDTDI